jgi:SAM-dependent methyltransferase
MVLPELPAGSQCGGGGAGLPEWALARFSGHMPTNPSAAREVAESFGVDAARYDRARPRYPDELIRRISRPTVLDVGTGTGIAARQLRAAGSTVLGVDPDPRMAAFARETGIPVEVATFETWDPAGRTFDAVTAGTAWHWVDPEAGAAKAARLLRPGGLLAPFWHVFSLPPDIAEVFAATYRRVAPGSPITVGADRQGADAYQPILDRAADGIRATGLFGEPEQWRWDSDRTMTRAGLLDLLPTQGHLTRLRPDRLAELLDAVGAVAGDRVTMPHSTVAIVARR